MAMWTMRMSDETTQDLVTVLIAAPRGAPGFDDASSDIDLIGHEYTAEPGIDVVQRVYTGADAIEQVLEIMPDVLVVHTGIDEVNARDVSRQIQQWAPATKILAVAAADDELLYTTVAAGASSALIVDRVSADLGDAACRLARGESLLPPRTAGRLLNDVDAWAARSSDPLYPPPTLTSTEREVLAHLGAGEEPSWIASVFGVTGHLVNVHAGYAVAKLHRFMTGADSLATAGG